MSRALEARVLTEVPAGCSNRAEGVSFWRSMIDEPSIEDFSDQKQKEIHSHTSRCRPCQERFLESYGLDMFGGDRAELT